MTSAKIEGDTAAMSAFSQQLTAPEIPPSLARLGTPPNLAGLFEGIAMSLLDKAATAEVTAYLAKVTEELVTYSQKVGAAAATYTAADVASAAKLVTSATKVARGGIGLVKKLSSAGTIQPADTEQPSDNAESAGTAPSQDGKPSTDKPSAAADARGALTEE